METSIVFVIFQVVFMCLFIRKGKAMDDKDKKLIGICITIIVCVCIICFTVYALNNNSSANNTTPDNTTNNTANVTNNTTLNDTDDNSNQSNVSTGSDTKSTSKSSTKKQSKTSDDEYVHDIKVAGTDKFVKAKDLGYKDEGGEYMN